MGVTLRHAWGWTIEESTPYLALRRVGADQGLVLHVLPRENWTIKISPVSEGGNLPYTVNELGLGDENLLHLLVPGKSLVLFNFILDADASGAELSEYTTLWYRLLDEIRAAYPRTFFEGCSSGAMRGDHATLSHLDGHFLSDTVNPVDVFRIFQSAWLRLPPGRLTR